MVRGDPANGVGVPEGRPRNLSWLEVRLGLGGK